MRAISALAFRFHQDPARDLCHERGRPAIACGRTILQGRSLVGRLPHQPVRIHPGHLKCETRYAMSITRLATQELSNTLHPAAPSLTRICSHSLLLGRGV